MRFSISIPVWLLKRTSITAEESTTINTILARVAPLQPVEPLEVPEISCSAAPEASLQMDALYCAESRPSDNLRETCLQRQLSPSAFGAMNQARFLFEPFLTCAYHTFMCKTCQVRNLGSINDDIKNFIKGCVGSKTTYEYVGLFP